MMISAGRSTRAMIRESSFSSHRPADMGLSRLTSEESSNNTNMCCDSLFNIDHS